MEKEKIALIVDTILFGLPVGDGVISVSNNIYHIQNKRSNSGGLIEELQIKTGSNLGINNIIAKKFRDGIIDGFVKYQKDEEEVLKTIKEVTKEEKEIKADNKKVNDFAQSIADDLAKEEPKPTSKKKK